MVVGISWKSTQMVVGISCKSARVDTLQSRVAMKVATCTNNPETLPNLSKVHI